MPFTNFFKIVSKALRYAFVRPVKRFNVIESSKKYLGPDAKRFMPAPRAIGAMSLSNGKPILYPHLEKGYKSLRQKRLEAINSKGTELLPSQTGQETSTKSYSVTKTDDKFIINASNKLEVNKTIIKSDTHSQGSEIIPEGDSMKAETKSVRPLPKLTNLQLQDPASIWVVDKVPPGRLSLNTFQGLMLNHLADEHYWTPARIAEKYDIKEEYAENITRNNPEYQASKHLVYIVDQSLRTEVDRQYDEMFLPETEQLDEEVAKVLAPPGTPEGIPSRIPDHIKAPDKSEPDPDIKKLPQ